MKYEYQKTVDGKFQTIYNKDNLISIISANIKERDAIIDRLENELATLKEEKWKDEELQRMKKNVEDMKHQMIQGFPLSDKTVNKIEEWKKCIMMSNKKSTNCSLTYEFTPTYVGTFLRVKFGDDVLDLMDNW